MLSPLNNILSNNIKNFQTNQIKYLKTIHKNTLKILKLNNDLINLNHLKNKLLQLQSKNTNLINLLQKIINHTQITTDNKNIQINMTTNEPSIHITIDIKKLKRTLTHLISTTIEYTNQNKTINLHMYPQNKKTTIIIQNNNANLPPN